MHHLEGLLDLSRLRCGRAEFQDVAVRRGALDEAGDVGQGEGWDVLFPADWTNHGLATTRTY